MQTLVAWTGLLLGTAAVLATLAGLVSALAELRRGSGIRWRSGGDEDSCWRRLCLLLHPYWKLATAYVLILVVSACLYRAWADKLAPKQNIWGCLYFSATTIAPAGFGDIKPNGPTRFVAVVESIGGMILLALLVAKIAAARSVAAVERHAILVREAGSVGETNALAAAVSNLNGQRRAGRGDAADRRLDRCLYDIGACLSRKVAYSTDVAGRELSYAICRADVHALRLYVETVMAALGDGSSSCFSADKAQLRILLDTHTLCLQLLAAIKAGCLEVRPEDDLLRQTLAAEIVALEQGLDACNQLGYQPGEG